MLSSPRGQRLRVHQRKWIPSYIGWSDISNRRLGVQRSYSWCFPPWIDANRHAAGCFITSPQHISAPRSQNCRVRLELLHRPLDSPVPSCCVAVGVVKVGQCSTSERVPIQRDKAIRDDAKPWANPSEGETSSEEKEYLPKEFHSSPDVQSIRIPQPFQAYDSLGFLRVHRLVRPSLHVLVGCTFAGSSGRRNNQRGCFRGLGYPTYVQVPSGVCSPNCACTGAATT